MISECSTDEDLLRAARQPDEPLWASGACRTQVLAKQDAFGANPFWFGVERLPRRIEADLGYSFSPTDSAAIDTKEHAEAAIC